MHTEDWRRIMREPRKADEPERNMEEGRIQQRPIKGPGRHGWFARAD
jgi:hypothetical protein